MKITKGYVFAIMSIVFMSLAGPLQKMAAVDSHPLWITLLSCSAAFLMALAFNLYKQDKSVLRMNRPLIILSTLYALAMTAFSFSISLENPFVVGAVARSYIGFAFLFSLYSLRESQTPKRFLSIMVIILGSILIGIKPERAALVPTLGVLLAFIYALLFAIHNSYLKSQSDISAFSILLWQNLIAVILILAAVALGTPISWPPLSAVGYSLLSGCISSFFGFLFYHQSLRHLGLAEATSIRAVSPIVAALIIAPLFPPTVTPFLVIGFLLILVGHYFYFKK